MKQEYHHDESDRCRKRLFPGGGGLFCRQEGPHQKKAYARAPGQAFRHLESAGRDVINNSGEIIK
jgi:hypothetical protein